jgi:hypothetical protein
MMRADQESQKGSILLVALCFVTVLGISLASYVAVCSRTMQISNRTAQTGLSRQLAEMGLEEALRAFNKNDWADWSNGPAADWSVSGTTATCNLTFPAGTFGQGAIGSVKIRVDNYDTANLNSTWISGAAYRVNDLIADAGIWYRCVQNHTSSTLIKPLTSTGYSNLTYWAPTPVPWSWYSNKTYSQDSDVVCYNGTWYRCILTHTSSTSIIPTNTTYWTSMPAAPVLAIYTNTPYTAGTFAFRVSNGTWYRCVNTNSVNPWADANWSAVTAPYISWAYRTGVTYNFNDVVFFSGTAAVPGVWYRCKVASTTSSPTAAPSDWENALSGSMHAWNSGSINYSRGDTVYYTGNSQWYRCIQAHTSSGSIPPNSSPNFWSNAPSFSTAWDPGHQYGQNDTVRHNGVWYKYINATPTAGQNPSTAATYWIGANTSNSSYTWNSSTTYSNGQYRCYGGVWYKYINASPSAGNSPNNSAYWTASWMNTFGVTTGAPVIYAEGTVTLMDGSPPITTQLRSTIAPASLFPNAVASATTITANSGGTVDSYDANSGSYASQVNTTTNYSAVVASAYSASTAITLSSTAVRGYVAALSSSSAPYAPLFSSGGTVKGFSSPGSPNIDLSRLSRSPYIPKFDTLPGGQGGVATNWSTIHKGLPLSLSYITNIGSPGAVVPSRYYYNGNLTIGTASLRYLRINGPVILYVNGDLFITATGTDLGRIDISSIATAEIHVTGAFKADAGGEGILSYNTDPESLIIISDTTGTATQFYSEGVNPLYGVIYMPYSTSTTGYFNDNTNTNIYGAVSANKITYSGANLNVHYDTSLRYATFGGVDQPYAVVEWRELTDPAERATMP